MPQQLQVFSDSESKPNPTDHALHGPMRAPSLHLELHIKIKSDKEEWNQYVATAALHSFYQLMQENDILHLQSEQSEHPQDFELALVPNLQFYHLFQAHS